MSEIDLIIKTKIIDIFMINESKLDSNIPSSFYSSPDYKIIRLDREGKCGVCETWCCSRCHVPKNGKEDNEHVCDPGIIETTKLLLKEI